MGQTWPIVFINKVLLKYIHLPVVYDCFHGIMAESSSCNGDFTVWPFSSIAENISCLDLSRNVCQPLTLRIPYLMIYNLPTMLRIFLWEKIICLIHPILICQTGRLECKKSEDDQMIKKDNVMIHSSFLTIAIDQAHQQLLNRVTRPTKRYILL